MFNYRGTCWAVECRLDLSEQSRGRHHGDPLHLVPQDSRHHHLTLPFSPTTVSSTHCSTHSTFLPLFSIPAEYLISCFAKNVETDREEMLWFLVIQSDPCSALPIFPSVTGHRCASSPSACPLGTSCYR